MSSRQSPLQEFPKLWSSFVLPFSLFSDIIADRMMQVVKENGCNLSKTHIWILLVIEEKPCNQRKCADLLRLNHNVMVRHVDRLERQGYVVRQKDPRNRRENTLHVTDDGKELLQQLVKIREEHHMEVFSPAPPEEIYRFRDMCLLVIEDHWRRSDEH